MNMKYLLILLSAALTLNGTSCVTLSGTKTHKEKTIPPGQAKKITGSKSAKPYAPGQNKR